MSLDYLVGRRADSVVVPLQNEDWKWAIIFDDATRLTYKGDVDRPSNVIESSVLGIVDVKDTQSELSFFKGSPAELAESVLAQTQDFEIEWAPRAIIAHLEQEDAADTLPPDPSVDRVVEGPVGGN
jgi:hypothetical protein